MTSVSDVSVSNQEFFPEEFVRALEDCGLSVSVGNDHHDADIHLQVTNPAAPGIAVQLLGPTDGAWPRSWCAVYCGPHRRQVWQGPAIDCPPQAVAHFVSNLLSATVRDNRCLERHPG